MPPLVDDAAKAERLALRGMACFTAGLFLIFAVGIALLVIFGSPNHGSRDVEGLAFLGLLIGFGLPGLVATVILIGLALRFRSFCWAGLVLVGLYASGILYAVLMFMATYHAASPSQTLIMIAVILCGVAILFGLIRLAIWLVRTASQPRNGEPQANRQG